MKAKKKRNNYPPIHVFGFVDNDNSDPWYQRYVTWCKSFGYDFCNYSTWYRITKHLMPSI